MMLLEDSCNDQGSLLRTLRKLGFNHGTVVPRCWRGALNPSLCLEAVASLATDGIISNLEINTSHWDEKKLPEFLTGYALINRFLIPFKFKGKWAQWWFSFWLSTKLNPVHNQKENYYYDHIPLNLSLKGSKFITF